MDKLLKLWKWLTEHEYKVEWYYEKLHRSHSEDEIVHINQIIVYGKNGREWDAICHYGSYGYQEGLLEIYGSICDDVIGHLTADDIIRRLQEVEDAD